MYLMPHARSADADPPTPFKSVHAHLLLKFFTLLFTGMEASLLSTPRFCAVIVERGAVD